MVPSEPPAPTLIVEWNHTALCQPFGQRAEVIPIFKERLRVPEVRDNYPASVVLVHGLLDHDERIRSEIAAAAGFVQFRGVAEIVNSCVGSFEQKESVAAASDCSRTAANRPRPGRVGSATTRTSPKVPSTDCVRATISRSSV